MMRVALSGGIASGKTTATNAFAQHGVPIVDTDIIAREVVQPGTDGLQQVVNRFGTTILDNSGALNRRKLREIVFSDEQARKDLEKILHPLIRSEVTNQLDQHQQSGALYSIVVIPLLVETNQQDSYDHVVIVDIDPDIQIKRVMARDNCSKAQAESILASQASRQQRLEIADDVLLNTSTVKALELQVKKIHEHITWLAKRAQKN